MSLIENVLGRISKGAAALFDKGKAVVVGPPKHLSYQRLKSKAVKVKHADLARVAHERRRFRNVVLGTPRRNTRGLPLGMSPSVARKARRIEVKAMLGHLDESGVTELEMKQADLALTTLTNNATARRALERASRFTRRTGIPAKPFPVVDGVAVLPRAARIKSCRPSVMVAALRERRQAFGAA